MSLLEVENLSLGFGSSAPAVDGLSFSLEAGASLGLLGASGSGKSLTALAILGLLPPGARRLSGSIRFAGRDLAALGEDGLRALRGGELGLVFQEPFSALNPLLRVGDQIAESLRLHQGLDKAAAGLAAAEALERVGLAPGDLRARQYPHQYSGGMRQRALLAMALAGRPKLLIADEPTTALDATVQAQVLALLRRLQGELGFALLIISHDLGVIHALASETLVLEAGRLQERAPLARLLESPGSEAGRRLARAWRALDWAAEERGS